MTEKSHKVEVVVKGLDGCPDELREIALYERPAAPAVPDTDELESALERLIERCNTDQLLCNDDAVIHAEATLERLYKSRTAVRTTTPPAAAPAPAVPQGVLADMREFASAKLPEFLGPHHMALTLSQKINEWADLLAAAPQGEPSLDLVAVCKEVSAMAVYVGDGECSIQFAIIQRLDAALAATPAAPSQEPVVPQGGSAVTDKLKRELFKHLCNSGVLLEWDSFSWGFDEGVARSRTPAAPSQPAVPQDSDPTSKEQYRRMFGAACEALGAINDALGCDPEDGGAEPILGAVEELQISLGLSNGILGCLSAAQALQEGEPVMWVMRAHETGQLNPAMPNQKAKHPKIWSDAFPLYVAPSQPVTLTEEVFGPIVKAAFDAGWAACRASELVGDNAKEFAWDMSGDEITERLIAALREKGELR